tara:strand:+ start:1859 stop:2161 length:303 start_codon:yes stop_codon:yes gene_type:complete
MSENNSNKVFDLSVEEVIRLETLMDVVASERNSIEGIRQAIIRAQERLKGYSDQIVSSKGGDITKNYQFDREKSQLIEIVEHSHPHVDGSDHHHSEMPEV